MLKQTLRIAICVLTLMVMLVKGVTAQASTSTTPFEVFGDSFVEKVPLQNEQSLVHVYRLADADGAVPINLYINGRYHSSLLAGAHVSFCVRPQTLGFQAVFDDAAQMHTGKNDFSYTFATQGGGVHYLRVQADGKGKTTVQLLAPSLALDQIKVTRVQLHSVSRVADLQKCVLGPQAVPKVPLTADLPPSLPLPSPAPVSVAPPVPLPATKPVPLSTQKMVLGADALFAFGKHQLTNAGKKSIRMLAQKVRKEYVSIDAVRVTGHSDPIGAQNLNKQLSLERAFAVVRALEQEGVKSKNGFEANGLGATQPIKPGCQMIKGQHPRTAKNIACHAKNRRVEIVVTGTRKIKP